MRTTAIVAWLASLLLTAAVRPVFAHEIGTTRVTANFPTEDTFRITIVTDGQALLEKLWSLQDVAQTDKQVNRHRFLALQQTFLDRIVIKFDTHVVRPAVDALFTSPVDETTPSIATVTLAGEGESTINLWMGEDGVEVDKVVLTLDPGYVPSAHNRAASRRGL